MSTLTTLGGVSEYLVMIGHYCCYLPVVVVFKRAPLVVAYIPSKLRGEGFVKDEGMTIRGVLHRGPEVGPLPTWWGVRGGGRGGVTFAGPLVEQ